MPNCKQYRLTSTSGTITVSQHSDHQIQGAMVEPSAPKICAESNSVGTRNSVGANSPRSVGLCTVTRNKNAGPKPRATVP
jgi:hypothetical protein